MFLHLTPSHSLSSGSSAFIWRPRQTPRSLWPVSFIHSGLFLLPASAVPSHSSDMPGPLTPLLANDLASDFTEKVRLTDEQTPSPITNCTPTRRCFVFSIPSLSWRNCLLSSQNESLYMSKPSQGSWPFNYQLSFLHHYFPEFSRSGSLL